MADAPPDVTLTAGVSGATRPVGDPAADLAPGGQIGRYRLIRVLGAGGMGVVWAAHDPDLDREVALKVLRHGDSGPAQRGRLLREARAMAKVRHPNVINVHEVGTADGRDFVSMEIIGGRTIAKWLGGKPSRRECERVFRDAGRGLAAAHAVGLVHRDFKPHNVLLDDDGRVVVTDFGLARAAGEGGTASSPPVPAAAPVSGLEQTMEVAAAAAAPTTTPRNRDLATLDAALTEAGTVLGTPAYMAPEQIDGAAAGPRADQFAYCVALWEALTGARPFQGPTIADLRRAIDRGPIGGGALSRGERAVLRRGLDPDPARRWPDMASLLRALERRDRRSRWLLFVLADVVVAAAVLAFIYWPRTPAAKRPCEIGEAFLPTPSFSPAVRPAYDRFLNEMRPAGKGACARGDEGAAMRACLVGESFASALAFSAGDVLVERGVAPDVQMFVPAVAACYAEPPPSFPRGRNEISIPEMAARKHVAVVRLRAAADDLKDLPAAADSAVAEARASGSCVALAEAQLARAEVSASTYDISVAAAAADEAAATADPCHYDRARAEAALGHLAVAVGRDLDRDRIRALRSNAEAAVERAGKDPLLSGELAMMDSNIAWIEGRQDDAITAAQNALAAFEDRGAIGLATATARLLCELLVLRGGPGDLAHADEIATRVEKSTRAQLGDGDPRTMAMARVARSMAWRRGGRGVIDALRARVQAHPSRRPPLPGSVRVTGRVVDEQGQPVAGADVVAGVDVMGDGRDLDMTAGGEGHTGTAGAAITGADGSFAIDDVAPGAWAIAQAADGRRSLPMPAGGAPTLRVAPTTRVTGRVALEDRRPSSLIIEAVPIATRLVMWQEVAPIADDGSFVLERLPRGHWSVKVREEQGLAWGSVAADVVADRAEVGPVALSLTSGGVAIDVVVRADRDTTIPLAQIVAVPGRTSASTLAALIGAARSGSSSRSTMTERAGRTDERVGDIKLERDDLRASLTQLVPGETTVCAIPLGAGSIEPSGLTNLYLHAGDVDVTCRTIVLAKGGPRPAMLFVVPPMKRIP